MGRVLYLLFNFKETFHTRINSYVFRFQFLFHSGKTQVQLYLCMNIVLISAIASMNHTWSITRRMLKMYKALISFQ